MKGLWNPKLSIQNNLETMGVAFDANKVVEQKTMKQKIIQKIKNENDLEPIFKEEKTASVDSDVVKKLESEVKEMEDNRTSCKHFFLLSVDSLTLICMRGVTFHSLFFLDQI